MSDYEKGTTYTLECGHTVTCGCSHTRGDFVFCLGCMAAVKITGIEDDEDPV